MYKNIFEGKKAAIFNLNGTVVSNTHDLRKRAVTEVLDDLGYGFINPKPYCVSGTPIKTIWESIIIGNDIKNILGISELETKTIEKYTKIIRDTELETVDGFWDLIYELKEERGFKTAVISDMERAVDTTVIDKLDVSNFFDVSVFKDDVKKEMPSAVAYKKILGELKIKPGDAVAFENSILGVKSAGTAGIDTILIWDGETKRRFFKGNIVHTATTLSEYVGNLDKTHLEYIAESCKGALEDKKGL